MSKIFGERLRELRKSKNYSQQQVAAIFNVTKTTVSAWETDKQEPCIEDIKKLAEILDTSTDYLLGYENEDGTKKTTDEFFYGDGTHIIHHKRS